jgi:multidrug resistance efflux pump
VRLQNLLKENLRSRNEYEDAEERAATAGNELVEANSRLTVLLRGTRPEEINATRAQADRLEEQRRYVQEQLRLLKIVSPTTGIVATPSRQLKEMRRMLVKKGDLILKVYDLKTLTAQILVPEKEIAGVQVGQKVVLRVRAFPDENFHGTVSSIATSAQAAAGSAGEKPLGTTSASSSASVNKTILVTTQIENRSLLLKPEMTGQAKIFCGQRRIVDLITRRMARTFKVEFWSWW